MLFKNSHCRIFIRVDSSALYCLMAALLGIREYRGQKYTLRGKRGISADTALRLARYFGTTAEFWLNLQSAYDLRLARQASGKKIEKTVSPRAA